MKKKELVGLLVLAIAGVMLILGFFISSNCQAQSSLEPYKVGLCGDVTGPAAGTHTGRGDGFRLYITDLNERGGINGRKIDLIFEDNAGVGAKAGASMKKFADARVHLSTLIGPSGVYASFFEEAKRANIPVLILTIGPHETVPPKVERLIYGGADGNAINATKMVLKIVKEQFASKEKTPTWGIVGIDIPVSRKGAEITGELGEKIGIKTVVKIAPLGTMDYTPIASALMDAGCNIVSTWGPGTLNEGIFKALNKVGYKGVRYINTPDPPEVFVELMKENPSIVYTHPNLIPLWADFPVDREIKAKAEKHGVRINSLIKIGWLYGMVVEEVLKRAGWPVTTENLVNILDHLDLDFGSAFPPIRFTPADHQGLNFQNGWSWSPQEKKFVVTLPWYVSNAAGSEIKVLPKDVPFPKVRFK
jgi:branched-chain amino acid transport system substrate-binding protein